MGRTQHPRWPARGGVHRLRADRGKLHQRANRLVPACDTAQQVVRVPSAPTGTDCWVAPRRQTPSVHPQRSQTNGHPPTARRHGRASLVTNGQPSQAPAPPLVLANGGQDQPGVVVLRARVHREIQVSKFRKVREGLVGDPPGVRAALSQRESRGKRGGRSVRDDGFRPSILSILSRYLGMNGEALQTRRGEQQRPQVRSYRPGTVCAWNVR